MATCEVCALAVAVAVAVAKERYRAGVSGSPTANAPANPSTPAVSTA